MPLVPNCCSLPMSMPCMPNTSLEVLADVRKGLRGCRKYSTTFCRLRPKRAKKTGSTNEAVSDIVINARVVAFILLFVVIVSMYCSVSRK